VTKDRQRSPSSPAYRLPPLFNVCSSFSSSLSSLSPYRHQPVTQAEPFACCATAVVDLGVSAVPLRLKRSTPSKPHETSSVVPHDGRIPKASWRSTTLRGVQVDQVPWPRLVPHHHYGVAIASKGFRYFQSLFTRQTDGGAPLQLEWFRISPGVCAQTARDQRYWTYHKA
jgi:hypothetical protein